MSPLHIEQSGVFNGYVFVNDEHGKTVATITLDMAEAIVNYTNAYPRLVDALRKFVSDKKELKGFLPEIVFRHCEEAETLLRTQKEL